MSSWVCHRGSGEIFYPPIAYRKAKKVIKEKKTFRILILYIKVQIKINDWWKNAFSLKTVVVIIIIKLHVWKISYKEVTGEKSLFIFLRIEIQYKK